MHKRLVIGGAAAMFVALSSVLMFSSRSPTISGEAHEMNLAAKSAAKVARRDGQLFIDLHNFPSFESDFEAPRIAQRKDGSIQVSLRSYSAGPFHRKSEQLTDLSFALPGQTAASGTKLTFHSADYDQVIISAQAP